VVMNRRLMGHSGSLAKRPCPEVLKVGHALDSPRLEAASEELDKGDQGVCHVSRPLTTRSAPESDLKAGDRPVDAIDAHTSDE